MSPFDSNQAFRRLARGTLCWVSSRTPVDAPSPASPLGSLLTFSALLVLALPLASCDALARAEKPTLEASAEPAASGLSLLGPEPLASAKLAIDDTLGPTVKVLELRAYPDHWVIQAEDPERPGRLFQLEYRDGRLGAPLEMTLRGPGELGENLFFLSEVSLAELPTLADKARKSVDPEDGVVDYVLVRRALPFDTDVRLRVFVKSPRRDGYLDADRTGRPIE
jgi:hypothetical protein